MKTFLRKSRILAIVFVIANLFFFNDAFGQATVTEPTVTLDQADLDYAPGETVYITGSGWKPGEVVTLEVDNLTTPEVDCGVYNPGPHELWTIVADGNGNFAASWYVNDCELDSSLFLEAYGGESGITFEIFFTDSNDKFQTSGLPNSILVTVLASYTKTNNAVVTNESVTFNSPGPSGSIGVKQNTQVFYTFPPSFTISGSTFLLTSTSPASGYTNTNNAQTVIGTYTPNPAGIEESYAIMNFGGSDVYYDLKATTSSTDFNGVNFGTYNSSQSLYLDGAQNKTSKCASPSDVFNGKLYYRIYPTSGIPGSFSAALGLPFLSNDGVSGCGGQNQTWQKADAGVNLLNGLCDGNYTIEVYTTADTNAGTVSANNGGANYKATFTVKNDDRSGIYQSAIVLKSNGGGDMYYDLQVNTPNNDFTGSIGSFCQTGSLVVAGAENKVFKCSPNDITGNSLRYRVYSGSPIGSFQTVGLGHASDDGTSVCGGLNQTWRSTSNPTNILTGLAPGTYTLEVYTEAAYTSNGICAGTHYSNNGGANYKATFTVLAAPIITTTYSDITVNNDVGQCGAVVLYTAAAATGSPTPEITYSTASGSLFPVGITTVTVTATNSCGVDTKTFTVTVTDNQIPVITSNGNKNVNNDSDVCGATVLVSATATDNCSVGIPTGVRSDALALTAVYPIGTTTITWNVIDSNANAATAVIQNVIVQDNVAPVAIAQAVTVQLDNLGAVSVTAAQVDNGSNDACGIQSLSVSPNAFTCANVGANTVTLTVTDNNGNVSTANAVVTVQDNIAPVAIAQAVTVQLDNLGAGSITAAQVDNGSNDACGIQSLAVSPNTFTCANVGANPVTLTVTDNNGNVSTATATVTVEDNIAPAAIAQAVTVQLDNLGAGSVTAAQVDNGSNDACGIQSLSVSPNTFTCANIGANPVTLTVTDNNGNVSTATATVTVEDNVAPVAIAQAVTVQLDNLGAGSVTSAQVDNGSNDACGIQSLSVSPNTFTCANVGANPVTLTVTDNNGNVSTANAVVTVQDNIAPVAIAQAVIVQLDNLGSGSVTAAQVDNGSNDACGIQSLAVSPNTFTCANVGANSVTLTVTDNNGNVSTANAVVTVQDNVAPVAIAQAVTVQLDNLGAGSVTAAQVDNGSNDACGIQSLTVSPNTFTCANVGANTVTLTVTDNNGNVSTATPTVTVEDNVAPVAIAQAVTVQLDNLGAVSVTAAQVDNGSNDACGIASLVLSKTAFTCADIATNPNTVVLTVTDNNGNVSTANATVTVVDNTIPQITCTADKAVSPNNTACTYKHTGTTWNAVATDNCSVSSIKYTLSGATTSSPDAFTTLDNVVFNIGVTTVTAYAYDASNNKSIACTFKVTVTNTLSATSTNSNNVLYYGYSGDQTSTFSVTPLGGTGPYTVSITMNRAKKCNQISDAGDESWTADSGSITTDNSCLGFPSTVSSIPISVKEISAGIFSVTVRLMADAIITATVTDSNGCIATTSKDIHAEDVRCFAGNSGNAKVTICHRTGSTKNPCVAICVDQSAVQEHLNHGDYVGICTKTCVAPINTKLIEEVEEETTVFKVTAYPNPSSSQFTLLVEGGQNEKVEVLVYDMLARLVKRIEKSDGQPILFGEELPTGEYLTIVKQGENMKAVNLIKQ